jgi:hypothetical protein
MSVKAFNTHAPGTFFCPTSVFQSSSVYLLILQTLGEDNVEILLASWERHTKCIISFIGKTKQLNLCHLSSSEIISCFMYTEWSLPVTISQNPAI